MPFVYRFAIFSLVLAVFGSAKPVFAASVTPNDPLWTQQWYLQQIRMPDAWVVSTGNPVPIVAVIDSGVDITHPDIAENIWQNPGEIPGDGIDNDHNGYIDDVHGWNFVTNSPNIAPLRMTQQNEEAYSHGTMVSSLIAARGNDGIGMAGINWHARIMPLTILDARGVGRVDHLIQAIRYATNQGATIINLSLVGYDYDEELDEMIARASNAGVLIVAATGNDARNDNQKGNLDVNPAYPVCDNATKDAVIGVSATNQENLRPAFANYGTRCTDLSAPGVAILAARPVTPNAVFATSRQYNVGVEGTSVAAPLVSGVASLVKSVHPQWSAAQIRDQLYRTSDPFNASGEKSSLGYGRLNAARALTESATSTRTLILPIDTPITSTPVLSVPFGEDWPPSVQTIPVPSTTEVRSEPWTP